MNKQSYLHFSIGAVSLLLIDLVLAMPAEANRFTCRASALRANKLLGQVYEPVVANPLDDPCATESKSAVSVSVPLLGLPPLLSLPLVPIIRADAVSANTVGAPPFAGLPVTAEGKVAGANILGVVTTGVLDATAKVTSVRGSCVLSSQSSVASVVVLGTPITLGATPLTLSVPDVGILHFNATLGGLHPTFGAANANSITQRSVWLEITNPMLQTTLGVKEVIVAEATADFTAGNPCASR